MAALALVSFLLDRTLAFAEEVQRQAEAQVGVAPVSAIAASDFAAEVAGRALELVSRWPA